MIQFDSWLEGAFHHGREGMVVARIAQGCELSMNPLADISMDQDA